MKNVVPVDMNLNNSRIDTKMKAKYFVSAILLLDVYFPTWFSGHNLDTCIFQLRGGGEETLVICTS